MKSLNLNARLKRNKLIEVASQNYRDGSSAIVNKLIIEGKDALLGIQRSDEVYTIVGRTTTYYSTRNGKENFISNVDLLRKLSSNAMNKGKDADYEFVEILDNESIWFMNAEVMNAIWNTILYINRNQ